MPDFVVSLNCLCVFFVTILKNLKIGGVVKSGKEKRPTQPAACESHAGKRRFAGFSNEWS